MDGSTNRGYSGTGTFLADYKLGKTVGHGAFSKVKVAKHVLTGSKVAVKILDRLRMEEMQMVEKVIREIKILRSLTHPHITRLYEVIETSIDIYVVMEYAESGELFDYIMEKGRLQEDEARILFQQIISGLDYCHRNMVVHRDLKPENLLLDSKGNVKIADFGFSNVMRDGHFLKTSCGSPNYAAPEVFSGKLYAGPEVDVWSCGVILYALLCAKLPFEDENMPNLIKKIKGGIYAMPSHLSPGARDLISRILVIEPMKRVTIPEIFHHPWFQVLPRYLAVPPADTINQAKKIDEEALQQAVNLGFDRNQLIESLYNRIQNKATVVYYLLLDNQYQIPNGHLNEASSSSVGYCIPWPVDYQQASLKQFPVDKKWALGIQSQAHPLEIMTEVLKALQELNVCWKKIGHYNMKCKFFLGIPSAIIENGIVKRSSNTVKFEVQLYKTRDDKYLLDLQRAQGPQFLFLDLCAAILTQLQVF